MNGFESNNLEMLSLIGQWEPRLLGLAEEVITLRRNRQNRNIKQILGHMADSASNNTHRVIHLQYSPVPLNFPDYANLGNNDRWIAVQNYEAENWQNLVGYWKYSNLHFIHVVRNINNEKLENTWISALDESISLKDMVSDYLRHFQLHLNEIGELINQAG